MDEELIKDLGALLYVVQAPASMGMFGGPGSPGYDAWVRIRDNLGLFGWHTAEEAASSFQKLMANQNG